jgi:hypothetical protein
VFGGLVDRRLVTGRQRLRARHLAVPLTLHRAAD